MKIGRHWLALLATFFAGAAGAFGNASGPTLHLPASEESATTNSISAFMYFVPLISPEPVASYTSGSSQIVRVTPARVSVNNSSFSARCNFRFEGNGSEKSVFDLSREIRRHQKRLQSGGELSHELKSIVVHGPGTGSIQIEGTISNGVRTVNSVRLTFDSPPSPVTIELCDIRNVNGHIQPDGGLIARVSTLTFRRTTGKPQMEVTVTSIKNENAGDSLWQNLKGRVKGFAANLFIPPLPVERRGHRAMLDFGLALISGARSFTFPAAAW